MLLFGDFALLPEKLRLSSWGLVRRFSDGFPEERESWFAWVSRDTLSALYGEEQKELRVKAYFPEWAFCMRQSVVRQALFADTAGPEFEFMSATPQLLVFKDRKLVLWTPVAESPAEPTPVAESPAEPPKTPDGTWQWVEPEMKTPAVGTRAKTPKVEAPQTSQETLPA